MADRFQLLVTLTTYADLIYNFIDNSKSAITLKI